LAVFLLYVVGRCIYFSEWVAQIRARNIAFSELESVSMIAVSLYDVYVFKYDVSTLDFPNEFLSPS
jgi:hypothetical protein